MTFCTICGKVATVGVYCDECRQMLEKRVNRGLVVTKPAIVSRQDKRQSSSNRAPRTPQKRSIHQERSTGMRIWFGKDGLPVYCPECGNLLYKDGTSITCKACDYQKKDENI